MKMRILVRDDLKHDQRAVQIAHSVSDACLAYRQDREFLDWQAKHKTKVIYKIKGRSLEENVKAFENNPDCVVFREPDFGNLPTAVAFFPGSFGILARALHQTDLEPSSLQLL